MSEPGRNEVLDALVALEDGDADAEQQCDYNVGWVHGYRSLDVARALYRPPRWRSATWTEVYPVLEALASAGEVIRVVPRRIGREVPVPVYRTVGA